MDQKNVAHLRGRLFENACIRLKSRATCQKRPVKHKHPPTEVACVLTTSRLKRDGVAGGPWLLLSVNSTECGRGDASGCEIGDTGGDEERPHIIKGNGSGVEPSEETLL